MTTFNERTTTIFPIYVRTLDDCRWLLNGAYALTWKSHLLEPLYANRVVSQKLGPDSFLPSILKNGCDINTITSYGTSPGLVWLFMSYVLWVARSVFDGEIQLGRSQIFFVANDSEDVQTSPLWMVLAHWAYRQNLKCMGFPKITILVVLAVDSELGHYYALLIMLWYAAHVARTFFWIAEDTLVRFAQ